ncbi:S-adenosyl-L-methionine-dependent methyltransferase [Dactylonectria macrodidyma]|uniref:S-adenosyl-L-methionine-dependent methyltransferase n=1 Tax=Dactylonectria macrodidyma TaxID=307937 RepID=A0A9P9FV46_9HYPO|nr:S-adenosyl-L-methionine-dependent methyltransferase [Dactylonectria macrodidyma]
MSSPNATTMSDSVPTPAIAPSEKTFSSYNSEQGKGYAQVRPDYHPKLYKYVLDQHTSTGGQLDTVVDVGCGPGLAARALAPHFATAIGLDPSEGMLATARTFGGTTSTSEPVRYQRATAEDLQGIADASVDLMTASNAAHWFEMDRFWVSAARVLKPGGTVAIWTSGEIRTHPDLPNSVAIQAAIERHRETHLLPYITPGSLLTHNRYLDLPLPWTLERPVEEFDQGAFVRKDWDGNEQLFVGQAEYNLDMFEKVMASGSPMVRWRQAHPELVGTDRDILKILRGEVARLLNEAGVEKGKEMVRGQMFGVVLIIKKKV